MWNYKIVEGMEELPEKMDIRAADKNPSLSTWPVRGTNQRLIVTGSTHSGSGHS
jgi:hypothetical protein